MTSMSPIFRRLPIEIICLIIEQTEDTHTLDNWYVATASTAELQRVALKVRNVSVPFRMTTLSLV